MSTMNFLKLCKILPDHDQCIQWYKEHNLLASSIKCPRENFSNAWRWRRRDPSRDGYESRCPRRNCNDMALMRTENTWTGVKQRTSKDLSESYLREWLLRQHYGDDPFGNIIKHIADFYVSTQRCVNCSCMNCS